MLVLSRKIGEQIVVPHCELSVTVVGISGNTVRLGVTAPAEIGVYREELWRRVGSRAAAHDQPSPPVTVFNRAPPRPRK
jgi:carbon storage regulator CsrA